MTLRSLRGIGCLALLAIGCAKPPPVKVEPPPAPVVTAVAQTRTVPVQVRGIGTVKAVSTVSIRPRVAGEITEVHFKEGDTVTRGQKLFTIDPRPYEAAVAQADATLTKDRAVLAGAEIDLQRLMRTGTGIAAAELDTARTAVAIARATIVADEAALNSAKIQAGYTTISSPLDGRTGSLLVTRGNLVSVNDVVPLVVVNQLTPIDAAFAIPEQQLPAVTAALAKGPLKVEAVVHGSDVRALGTLAFIDNAVDTTTGTVQLKGRFENADLKLWPGLFVDVVLTIADRPNSVVVPAAAVQSGQKGQYVYVVSADNKATVQPVTVLFDVEGNAVIETGLKGGETVVVEGQLRLAPGVKVNAKPTTPGTAR